MCQSRNLIFLASSLREAFRHVKRMSVLISWESELSNIHKTNKVQSDHVKKMNAPIKAIVRADGAADEHI